MRRIISISVLFLILSLSIMSVYAINQDELNQAKTLIDSNISCNKLTNDQLEIIGEYFMEQMHPGEAHELMHKMMGLQEESEAEEQFHISMAKTVYCEESGGMMMGNNMMSSGGMGSGMMKNYPAYYDYNSFWNISWLVFLIGIIALIIWFIYKFTKKGRESETPINILQRRHSSGEISKKHYEKMKKELSR